MEKSYIMIHVIKHDIDPNSNINYSRKIGPMILFLFSFVYFENICIFISSCSPAVTSWEFTEERTMSEFFIQDKI